MSQRDFFSRPLQERLQRENAAPVIRATMELGQLSCQRAPNDVPDSEFATMRGDYGRCAIGLLLTDAELAIIEEDRGDLSISTPDALSALDERGHGRIDRRNLDISWLEAIQVAHDQRQLGRLSELTADAPEPVDA